LREGYDGADVWSLGVILFNLITRTDFWCFIGQSRAWARMRWALPTDQGFQQLQRGTARLPDHVNPDAAQAILAMLTIDPTLRPSLEETLCKPWLCAGDKVEHIVDGVISDIINDAQSNTNACAVLA